MLDTIIEGGTGSNSKEVKMPMFYPDRFEGGTQNIPGIIALLEGVKFVSGFKKNEILSYELELSEFIKNSLKEISDITVYDDMKNKSGVFSFNIESLDSEIVGSILDAEKICIRSGFHCAMLAHNSMGTYQSGTVRVSPNIFNTKNEAVEFIDIIYKILK
jgi:selenocysteine lyase/cysteine desulfurase